MAESEGKEAQSTESVSSLRPEEAMEVLLSPDGYYTYLQIPKPSPVAKPAGASSEASSDSSEGIDLDLVKRNYRRLSLRHHPDRRGGDPETFRLLHRAKVVLSSPKLRREYDLVGLDLEDDAEDHDDRDDAEGPQQESQSSSQQKPEGSEGASSSSTDSVMSHLASATLAAVLQMVVRTGMMAAVSLLVSRYLFLTFVAIGLLFFLSVRIYQTLKTIKSNTFKDAASPLLIAVGIVCMNRGRRVSAEDPLDWSWTFWLGETLVMALFLSNSFEKKPPIVIFFVLSLLVTLILRGKFWRYMGLLGLQAILSLLVVLIFPMMEMILEEIVQEKMRKVGEKIRAHNDKMKECHKKKSFS